MVPRILVIKWGNLSPVCNYITFRRTGKYPLNKDPVMKKLPGFEFSPRKSAANVSDSFIEFLKKAITNDTPAVRRRRKLTVPAGKSIMDLIYRSLLHHK